MNEFDDGSVFHALDLSHYHKKFERGSLRLYITWTQHDKSPCMVFVPRYSVLNTERVTPCVIPDTLSWAWAEETSDGAHAAEASGRFCANLGMPDNFANRLAIISMVHDYMDDLLTCPPQYVVDQTVVGTTRRRDLDTGQITEGEITEDV